MAAAAPDPRRLADVSEDEVLQAILPFFDAGPADLVGPGDDAAVIAVPSGCVVATTDAMTRGRDWLDDWSGPADVAIKSLTQNLADVAAMGARPSAVLVTLLADPQTPFAWVLQYARALGDGAASAGVSVAGGDLSSAPPGVLTVSVTALGDLQGREPVLRSGARAGDVVAVRGSLGRSGAGLHLLRHGIPGSLGAAESALAQLCLEHHRRPVAPVLAGPEAARAGAHAMLDISDGLLRDGSRLADASAVRLDFEQPLLAPHIDALSSVVGWDVAADCVLAGGEEHSLLATFAVGAVPPDWLPVGRVTPGAGVSLDGEPVAARGWDHFRS